VDLAGSERQKDTNATGNRLMEAIKINKSLTTLSNVIKILSENITSNKKMVPPYRESILTHILRDSIGGNSLTSFIICISPAYSS